MNIYDIYLDLDYSRLEEFLNIEQEENLNLDFKTVNDSRLTNRDDKKNFAKALSGFANSSGGIIVWGCDARKNPSGIDCITSLNGISNAKQFLSKLNELTGMAVSPIVDRVQHKIIDGNNEKQFAVTYVPESESGPHMAKLGEDRYYKRSGDSFYRLEHFDLEDMFGRRPKPKLDLYTKIRGYGLQSEIVVGLSNNGKASASAPYLGFSSSQPFNRSHYGLDGKMNEGMKRLLSASSGMPNRYGDGANVIIHPGMACEIAVIGLGFNPKKPTEDLTINYEIAAEGVPLTSGGKVITLKEMGIE
jgi:hypothetical protein